MKKLSRREKILLGVSLTLLCGLLVIISFTPKPVIRSAQRPHHDSIVISEAKPVEAPAPLSDTTAEPVAQVESSTPQTDDTIEPPTVLTAQEYAAQYISIYDYVPSVKVCLDRLVSMYPDRFTPDVREKNVKALRAVPLICVPSAATMAGFYGKNGEWFDSQEAIDASNR